MITHPVLCSVLGVDADGYLWPAIHLVPAPCPESRRPALFQMLQYNYIYYSEDSEQIAFFGSCPDDPLLYKVREE